MRACQPRKSLARGNAVAQEVQQELRAGRRNGGVTGATARIGRHRMPSRSGILQLRYMWELIANGLGLAGTGYSILSGFSLDKKVDAISASLGKLEDLHSQLNERIGSASSLLSTVSPLISGFAGKVDPNEQLKTAQLLADYTRRWQVELEAKASALFIEVIREMRNVADSARLTQSSERMAPEKLIRALYHDPFDAGIVEYRDISDNGIYGISGPYIVSPHLTPISWRQPQSGRRFLGKISNSDLERYGIRMSIPNYTHTVDGHVYSDRHGLYLPSYMV